MLKTPPKGILIFIGDYVITLKSGGGRLFSRSFDDFINSCGGEEAALSKYSSSQDYCRTASDLFTYESQPNYSLEQRVWEDRSVYDGKLLLSDALHDWIDYESSTSRTMASKIVVQTHNPELRSRVGVNAPVAVLFNLGYQKQDLYENISLASSGLDLGAIANLDVTSVGGIIDSYVSTQDTHAIITVDDVSKIEGKGFDKKVSFRHRK